MNRFLDYSELPRIILEAVVILCFGILVGLTLHFQLVREVLEGKLIAPPGQHPVATERVTTGYPEPVDLQSVRQQIAAGTLLVDARIEELYRQGHLPESVSLPLAEVESRLPKFREEHPLQTPIIVYCNGYGCPDSFDLAMRLLESGYRKVMVFEGGFPEWEGAGLPIEAGE